MYYILQNIFTYLIEILIYWKNLLDFLTQINKLLERNL